MYRCILLLIFISMVACHPIWYVGRGNINQLDDQQFKKGLWVETIEGDSVIVKHRYNKNGIQNGRYVILFPDGAINTGKSKNFMSKGVFKRYDSNGKLISKVRYRHGREVYRKREGIDKY